jgi:hypothetical protein
VSEWTVTTLKEHYDALLTERDLRYQQRFEAGEKRLDGMNEFRGALKDAQSTFVTWPMVVTLIIAACAIMGVVAGFMRK